MGTNVHLSSPVCFDRSNLTSVGTTFAPENLEFLPRQSGRHLMLSDSAISLDLFRDNDDDDDLPDIDSYSFVEAKDGVGIPPTSPSCSGVGDEMMKSGPSSSSKSLGKLGFSEKGVDLLLTPSDCSSKGGMGHRSKGRPAKLGIAGAGNSSSAHSIIQCPICSKNFNNSSALAKHKLIHSEERKYSCSVCSKAFKRQDHLNGHMMTHSSKKPYECKYLNCDKSYCDQRSLRRHLENHHQHCTDATPPTSGRMSVNSGDSVFQFDGTFMSNFSGRGLESTSSAGVNLSPAPQKATWPFGYNPLNEPKPVKCVVCDRGFKNLPALNGHMRLHGGFVKKDLVSAEKRSDDIGSETPKTDGDDIKDPNSQSLDSDNWPLPSANEVSLGSELFRVKQEVVTTDEGAENISDCSNYLLSSGGGRLQKNEKEYKNDCFVGMHLLKSETLPAMEELRLKDGVDHQISAEDAHQLLAEALSDDLSFSGDMVSKCEKSSNGLQHSLYGGNRFEVADSQPLHFSAQSGDSKLIGAVESIQTGSDQQSVAMLSKYGMLGASGNGFSDRSNLPAASGGDGYLCGSSVVGGGGGMLHRNFMDNKLRRATEQQPLTPGYVTKRGFASATSSTQCSSSAQCTPVSPFAGRAVYPTSHNPSQSSLNSTMFEFPPTNNNLLDGGIAGHSSTPIHSNYSLAQQHTPLSPYTPLPNAPYTPKNSSSSSRLSRFQFSPSSSGHKDGSACESPYQLHQKSAYHPYNPHSSLPSPRYTQMHHQQLQQQQQQQMNNDNFERNVMEMDKEIERLKQIVEEGNKNNILPLGQSFRIRESGLYRQQEAICETAKRLQCLGSDPDTLVCNRDQNINPPISFGKYPSQQRPFLDEKIDHERSEFDMDLELETLNMLNLSGTDNIPDKKFIFAETSMGQEIGDIDQLGGINMFILEDHYGDISNEIALNEISDVDILVGRNEASLVSGDSLEMNFLASSAAGVVGSKMDDQRVQPSVPSWMNPPGLPRYAVVSGVRKDEMFLNPNQLSGFKRRKCRPDPIVIPPCVNNFQTITNPHYSPSVVTGIRKNPLPTSHQPPPPPPYTALPVNGPVNGDYGSFQVSFDIWAPQSAPTFHCAEDGLISDHSSGIIRQEKPMFSWDQNSLDSLIETEMRQFPASSCYSLISDDADVNSRAIQHLSLRSNSSKDELALFGASGSTELGLQEHRIWKTDDLNGFQQNLLKRENML